VPATVADMATRQICPSITGGINFWPASYSRKTKTPYPGCGRLGTVTVDKLADTWKGAFNGSNRPGWRITSQITAINPSTGERRAARRVSIPTRPAAVHGCGVVMTGLLDFSAGGA
jgi:hypothetical protein